MINRLELMWQQLEVPSLQRFDFMCKYVRPCVSRLAVLRTCAGVRWGRACELVNVACR